MRRLLQWIIYSVLSLNLLCSHTVLAHSRSRGPLRSLLAVDDPVIRSPSHRVHAKSNFEIVFKVSDAPRRTRLLLEPNDDVIPEGAGVTYLNENGEAYRWEPIDRLQHRVFKGSSWVEERDGSWTNVGWARINMITDGHDPEFEGAFSLMHDNYHVQLRHKFLETMHGDDPLLGLSHDKSMVMWRDSDTVKQDRWEKRSLERACSADKLHFNTDPQHPVYQGMVKRSAPSWGSASLSTLFGKRQIDTSGMPTTGNAGGANLTSTIGQTAGCPGTRKVALIGVATDCTYTSTFGSENDTRSHVIQTINAASEAYEKTFNITLGLQNLTVNPASCPGTPSASLPWNIGCDANTTITDRLNTFSQWRGQFQDTNAYWMLLTNCNTGAEVGLSWLGELCVNKATTGNNESTSGANVVAKTSTEWQVIAHESGHMFGAVHDCDSQTCSDGTTVQAQQCCPLSSTTCDAGGQFIMNPSTGSNINAFSLCSIGNICSAMRTNSVQSNCLSDNKGVTTITGKQCGNGIVEEGEDCDCGGPDGCKNDSCCNPTTCKFTSGAVCDDANEDCCHECQFATNGTVCRASTGVCDPQEVCSGTSAACPSDNIAPNGQSCGNGLQCASGQCTSRDQQCKTLMGSLTSKNDTYACDATDCTLTCASPDFPANQCYRMQQNFLDGTPCGNGNTCTNGVCPGSDLGGQISSWFDQNRNLVIGLAAGIGGFIVLLIAWCCINRCIKRRRPAAKVIAPSMGPRQWPGAPPMWNGHQYPNSRGYGGQSVRYA